ncbi:hypothetical protein ABK040_007189 [Willaertia magna]
MNDKTYEFDEVRNLFKDDQVETETSKEQYLTERSLFKYFRPYVERQELFLQSLGLFSKEHANFCKKGLRILPSAFDSLDASRPWFSFWCLNALDLLPTNNSVSQLEVFLKDEDKTLSDDLEEFLCLRCQHKELGGFGGGPFQLPHSAPTFASVISLCIVSRYDKIDREKIRSFLLSLKDPVTKGFRMHPDGEVDMRGCFTALVVANLLNILDEELMQGVDEYILSCQTYEGGISALPGNEAHGGYTYCGLAAMMLMKKAHLLDLEGLLHWTCRRQMNFEGGFQGRTNKLVDACYSFWVGAVFPLIEGALVSLKDPLNYTEKDRQVLDYLQWEPPKKIDDIHRKKHEHIAVLLSEKSASSTIKEMAECSFEELDVEKVPYWELDETEWMFDQTALQEYLLLCCQQDTGGLRDKPSRPADYYHTCYALLGLSIAQHNPSGKVSILGSEKNEVSIINPLCQMRKEHVTKTLQHFGNRSLL